METHKTKELEIKAINELIDEGSAFHVEKKSFLKYFGSKTRTFVLKAPCLGTLDRLGKIFIEISFDETALRDEPFLESKRLISEHSKNLARIIAIAVLRRGWQLKLFYGALTRYFLWRLTPSQVLQVVLSINKTMEITDFIGSIRLVAATKRTTQPKADRVEQNQNSNNKD